ncbi:MAG: 4-(cytidine 5'-diphospho)-2-C-methyl-D-erythritol kinase [Magnetococcales bacterium]|nr:4-(cytidine 5'-diphospho)-2-C-methyl-D-erythritol kinase [Magnetococcales bacterium]
MVRQFLAPAKVNLALRIVGRRADGFHLLWTVMTFFPLYDLLEIDTPAADLQFTCDPPVTAVAEDNLVWRAARLLQEASGTGQGAHLHLRKAIPHGAGLGGGSSDAATTLLALNTLWGLHWPLPPLLALGERLGADVPLFLGGTAALAEGIGERLTPLPQLAAADLVLIHPGVSLSTAEVFRHWHRHAHPESGVPPPLLPSCTETLLPLLVNDLESTATALQPVIAQLAVALRQQGALGTLMSGSGSSVWGLFAGEGEAQAAAQALRRAHPEWQIFCGRTFNQHPLARG